MDQNQTNYSNNSFEEDENINLRQILEQYLYYWKWFVLGVIIAVIGALIYLKYTQKQYQVTAKILLNEKESAAGELAGLTDAATLFGGSANSEVGDQIEILKSRRLISKIVEQNNLNIRYFSVGRIAEIEMVAEEAPIKIIFLNEADKLNDELFGDFLVSI